MIETAVGSASSGLARTVAYRTRGRTHGPVTRLMSPSDFGKILKPFVFLDLIDHNGDAFDGPLHPHSGIATLTYMSEGEVNYIDPDDVHGTLPAGGVEWMQAGRGMWHGGGIAHSGRTRGFQLWIALPPELELGPTVSLFQGPDSVRSAGPARVLLGRHEDVSSAIVPPSSINYLAVRLQAGERWRYQAPSDHLVLWAALAKGSVSVPDLLQEGELIAFETSNKAVEFFALSDAEFVIGSAAPHEHELALGYYSVHTTPAALRDGEAHISLLKSQMVREGRL